ncbi:hypothetical protein P43SY_005668 [Pythium insidiosum]|uniref:ABC transmembrane type-1 domain-containing protein n=1 Tax=Pythium insidiosum TaxID=114742 RepID=A0AAD5LBZ0_PYTIN|nr:hypothetical protein P43SY_005668 [Pythium insidiosum]
MATTTPINAGSAQPRKHYGALPTDTDGRRLDLHATSWWSQLLFRFVDPVMAVGNQRQLGIDDLWEVQGENQTARAYDTFKRQFDRCRGSVLRAMAATYAKPFLACGAATLFTSACSVFAPAVLHHVVDAFTADTLDFHDLSLWLGAFFLSKLVNAFVVAQSGFYLELVALRLVNAMKSLLFEKALRRSVHANHDADVPDLVNLFSSDVNNVLWAAFNVNMLWILPLQIAVVLYMLYNVIDLAAFAGLGVIAVSMFIGYFIAKAEGDAFDDIMERKDTRMKTIKEVFGSIQIVKLNGWEDKFVVKIERLRDHELKAVTRFMYWGALSICTLWSSPLFVSMTSFAVYSLVLGNELTAAKVFTSMALFNAIREPLRSLPEAVSSCIQAKVSIDRMQTYLNIDEVNLSNTFWQGFQIASDFWLSHWTGQKLQSYNQEETAYNMKVYALLGSGSALMVSARALTVSTVGLRASRHLFESMLKSLVHAPLRFFDANPIGRIVNRFGDDMSSVDFNLPFAFGGMLAMLFLTVFQLATAVYTVNFLGIFVVPIVILYIKIGNYFLAPSREISRLWKVTTSPLLSHVTSSEGGTTVLRAFGPDYVRYAIDENCSHIDANNKVWFAETAIRQWFQLRMQLLGCGVVVVIVSALVYLHDVLSPGIIGLAFTYALSVEGGMTEVVENWSRLEVAMVSPERILEYASIPSEGDGCHHV